jgi:FkbH-like protein
LGPEQSQIVVAANFTADPIAEPLRFWIRQFGWADEVVFAPYHQLYQTLLDERGVFAANRRGVNVALVHPDRIDRDEWRRAVEAYRARGGAPLIVQECVADPRYPVAEQFDSHAEQLGDVPFTPLYFAALGTRVARAIHAHRVRPFKAIALDCDNTLWRGTCGEDGPEGVALDEPARRLQEFMRAQRDAGMLLVLVSKNNEADVAETFAAHPEMPLRYDDFVARRVDWSSKASNLEEIAAELSLGLDSFIFVDDSAKEIAEMRAAHPDVVCLELPHNPSRIPHFLEHVWAFDRVQVTEEDRLRHELYRTEAARGRLERESESLEKFLEELQLEVRIQAMSDAQVARVAQLTQRTNQMNTTLIRRTEQEVRGLHCSDVACSTVEVSDRFGSYGLVGAIFLVEKDDTLVVENLLLSCRALGRGVEQRMLAWVHEEAARRGKSRVEVPVVEGPRNQPARDWLAGRVRAPKPATSAPKSAVATAWDYGRIARDLSRPAQIVEAIRAGRAGAAQGQGLADPPQTELERQVAELWSEVLHVAHPGLNEDFFDLGGHSLLAVQLLSRVRQVFDVELSLDLVYAGKLTIATMAGAVELARADPAEVDRLVAEIEGLSEEELRALLAEE